MSDRRVAHANDVVFQVCNLDHTESAFRWVMEFLADLQQIGVMVDPREVDDAA